MTATVLFSIASIVVFVVIAAAKPGKSIFS